MQGMFGCVRLYGCCFVAVECPIPQILKDLLDYFPTTFARVVKVRKKVQGPNGRAPEDKVRINELVILKRR